MGLLIAAIFAPAVSLGVLHTANYSTLRCKYSVRDVAFVNVHGNPWQLQLQKPADATDDQVNAWSETLRTKLEHSNVDFVWLEERSFNSGTTADSSVPQMKLVGPGDTEYPVEEDDIDTALDGLLGSPARSRILEHVVDALCVVLVVESGDREIDAAVRETVQLAAGQIERRMWTLEKPTDHGPAIVTVAADQIAEERWLLNSLGIDKMDLPSVAIVYGQGRRLGEVLSGDSISVDTLTARAGVCGSDCECDLDRDWLYGQQMIHSWSRELERAAGDSLSFDPHAAFVVAEVAQIIQKNAKAIQNNERVDIGGGLVIHDLDNLPAVAGSDEGDGSETADSETGEADTAVSSASQSNSTARVADTSESVPDISSEQSTTRIPWSLFFGLIAGLVAMFGWMKLRNHKR